MKLDKLLLQRLLLAIRNEYHRNWAFSKSIEEFSDDATVIFKQQTLEICHILLSESVYDDICWYLYECDAIDNGKPFNTWCEFNWKEYTIKSDEDFISYVLETQWS